MISSSQKQYCLRSLRTAGILLVLFIDLCRGRCFFIVSAKLSMCITVFLHFSLAGLLYLCIASVTYIWQASAFEEQFPFPWIFSTITVWCLVEFGLGAGRRQTTIRTALWALLQVFMINRLNCTLSECCTVIWWRQVLSVVKVPFHLSTYAYTWATRGNSSNQQPTTGTKIRWDGIKKPTNIINFTHVACA